MKRQVSGFSRLGGVTRNGLAWRALLASCGLGMACLTLSAAGCQSSPSGASTTKQSSANQAKVQTKPKQQANGPAPQKAASPPVAGAPKVERSRFPSGPRLVAIGDVHGDLAATRQVLQLAGAIGPDDRWIGGKLVVVQTGDQLDRGDDEKEIFDLLERVATEAKRDGGALIVLNGNHELMNAQGDFRYVTPGALNDFSGSEQAALPAALQGRVPPQLAGRVAAFMPGGTVANQLAQRPVIAIVGDTVFVHGGVLEKHVRYGIDRINTEVRAWLQGYGPPPQIISGEDSPVWSRVYSEPSPDAAACKELQRVLSTLGAKRMVVGHTVQDKGITSACDDGVWRIDVGMSAHYGGCCVAALEITESGTKVLRHDKSEPLPVPANTAAPNLPPKSPSGAEPASGVAPPSSAAPHAP